MLSTHLSLLNALFLYSRATKREVFLFFLLVNSNNTVYQTIINCSKWPLKWVNTYPTPLCGKHFNTSIASSSWSALKKKKKNKNMFFFFFNLILFYCILFKVFLLTESNILCRFSIIFKGRQLLWQLFAYLPCNSIHSPLLTVLTWSLLCLT